MIRIRVWISRVLSEPPLASLSCISVPIPIQQCSCFTGFPLVFTHGTDRQGVCLMALLMTEQMTTWATWEEWTFGLGEFSSGTVLHLEDMVFFLALPELSLADVLHEVMLSHFQSVNLSREDCSGEPQCFCLCYSGWETSRVKTRDTVSLEGTSAIWCMQGWG